MKKYLILLIISFNINSSIEVAQNKFIELLNASKKLSPELKKIEAQSKQSTYNLIKAYQDHLPKVQLDIKKTKDFYESNSALMTSLGLNNNDYSWGFNYQWEIFNFGLLNQTRKSHTDKNIHKLELQNTINEFDIKFTSLLQRIVLAKFKLASLDNSIKKAETSLKEVQLGFQLGHKTKIDVLRSEANTVSLKSKRSLYLEEEVDKTNTFLTFSGLEKNELSFLNDLDENQLLEFIENNSRVTEISKGSIENSPLLKKVDLEIKSQKYSASMITKDEIPRLYIQGAYSGSAETWSNTFHHPKHAHSVALVLSIPIFSFGTVITSSFEEYFQKKQIEYIKTQNRFELSNSLETMHLKMQTLKDSIDSTKLNVMQFEELFKLTQKSFQLGKSSLYELLDVQDNLLNSKIQLAEAKINYFEMASNYQWQIGNIK